MTVAELINKLIHMPPDARVETEGCDCVGPASDVELDQSDNTVIIRRQLENQARTNLLYPSTQSGDINDDEITEEAIRD